MAHRHKGYIPSLGYDWLLRCYDPLIRLFFREEAIKQRLVREAGIAPGDRVLDVGCGTATLTILTKTLHPDAVVFGLDGDPKALAIARRKACEAGAEITLDEGLSYDLPYPDASFDRVLSSLIFHHLSHRHKIGTLAEIFRVLAPGGSFHLLDFGKPTTLFDAHMAHLLHRGAESRDNIEGRLTALMQEAGFIGAEETGQVSTIIGRLSYFCGTKQPAHSGTAAF